VKFGLGAGQDGKVRHGQAGPVGIGHSLFTQVTQRLAVAIVSGELPVGALVPNEDSLGAEIVASRTAYREAMRFLAGKGLIEAKPRSGTRVAPRSAWHLLDPDVLRWSLSAAANEEFIRDLFELQEHDRTGMRKICCIAEKPAATRRIAAALRRHGVSTPYTEDGMRHDLRLSRDDLPSCRKRRATDALRRGLDHADVVPAASGWRAMRTASRFRLRITAASSRPSPGRTGTAPRP